VRSWFQSVLKVSAIEDLRDENVTKVNSMFTTLQLRGRFFFLGGGGGGEIKSQFSAFLLPNFSNSRSFIFKVYLDNLSFQLSEIQD
jgi:hypothetical protein